MAEDISSRTKFAAILRVARFRPALTVGIITLSVLAAVLEGIGLSFLLPIIRLAQGEVDPSQSEGVLGAFVYVYQLVGVPFELGFVILGVSLVMITRFTSSFLVSWLRGAIATEYVRYLQVRAFDRALQSEVAYFDEEGSDDILNAIVTQSRYAGRVIGRITNVVEQGFLSLMYLAVALYLAPILTIGAAFLLGSLTFLLRNVLQSGYSVGDKVASANEQVQEAAQAGTQGIRDVKLFGMERELFEQFQSAARKVEESTIKLRRNEAALDKFYQLATALTVFVLIYTALTVLDLTLGILGVFLFAMFRLAPRVSTLNNQVYRIEGILPHLIRTQEFIDRLTRRAEVAEGGLDVPPRINQITFDDVSFEYPGGEQVFDDLSFTLDRGKFAAFVGPSGGGKSTIVALLTRMYQPGEGEIRANGNPIDAYYLREWRSKISVVRQQPFIFNDTLRYNLTIANRGASRDEIDRVCEIAQVSEFIGDLPDGYDTVLGDDGVRLSGGQRQRVALARALLKDADYLILDEATSDLDSNIEEEVHRAIEAMDRDYAMLVIAHRLSTVTNADVIYSIVDGQIEESGSHDELVSRDGTYADLYATQRGD